MLVETADHLKQVLLDQLQKLAGNTVMIAVAAKPEVGGVTAYVAAVKMAAVKMVDEYGGLWALNTPPRRQPHA